MPGGDDSAQLLELHRRLPAGTASEEVVRLLHASLTQEISAQFRHTDQHIIWDGVIDAMLDSAPGPSNSTRSVVYRSSVFTPGCQAQRREYAAGEQRRKAREEAAGHAWAASSVELDPAAGNLLQKEESTQRQRQQTALTHALQESQ